MRGKHDDQLSSAELDYISHDSPKKSRISYTREFLVSLGELAVCKKLSDGFDPTILSDFGEAFSCAPERPRIPGTLSSLNFRREYGSSPPTRGDSGNYSRGTQGRWDTRSSGSNDKDSDTQLDSETDSGRRYGNQSWRPWQNPEHDGLLGSGAFSRPSGAGPGASSTKVRGNGFQLNRSNEPYHPPRPYKAVPHSRREDSINDETFGSSEVSSQDREEEERKRRASFEQFRKEQKEFHEKHKQFPDKRKESDDPDIIALLADSENDKKLWDKSNQSEDAIPGTSQGDSAKSLSTASRPLVPPGFTSTVLEKSSGTKSFTQSTLEVRDIELDSNITHRESNLVENKISGRQVDKKSESQMDFKQMQYDIKNPILLADVSEKLVIQSSAVKVLGDSVGTVGTSNGVLNLSEAYHSQRGDEVTDFDTQKVPGHVMHKAGQEHSTSILEKLFRKASTANSGGSSFIESYQQDSDAKVDEAGSNIPFQSSKFTHWFSEEEKKPTTDLSSVKPTDLLSLIVGGEKGGSQDSRAPDEKQSEIPDKGNELLDIFTIPSTASATGAPGEPLYHNAPDATGGVLTCEDLEQSILSEISEKNENMHHSEQSWSSSVAKAEHTKAEVDNHASQHLLSLLKKESSTKDPLPSPNLGAFPEDLNIYESGIIGGVVNTSVKEKPESVNNSGKTLTLETLFGSSFMNALHSVDAPVSVHKGSIGGTTGSDVSEPQGFPFRVSDDGFFPFTSDNTIPRGDIHSSSRIQQTKSNTTDEHWFGYDAPQSKVEANLNTVGATAKGRADEELEIRLPEEESLIMVGDPIFSQHSVIMPVANAPKAESLSFASTPIDIVDRLAAFNASLRSERSTLAGLDGPTYRRGPYDPLELDIPFQNFHGRPSSPSFAHMQLNHGRPSFQPIDSNHPQINHPELAPHHHFPANMFRPPFQAGPGGLARFDSPQHHILQQMHMPGNHLQSHLLQGLPRDPAMPPFPINHMTGYVPEMNPIQGFPFSHRQPNYGGHEMPMPASGVVSGGSNHPESLEKLIEMELRANLKQMPPPVAGAAHGLGNHSHGIDMGFRYR